MMVMLLLVMVVAVVILLVRSMILTLRALFTLSFFPLAPQIPPAHEGLYTKSGKERDEQLQKFYDDLKENPPFELKLVNKNGASCSWFAF